MKTLFFLSILAVTLSAFHLSAQESNTYVLNNGSKVKLPLQYENFTWIMATFTLSIEQAKTLLPKDLVPITVSKDKALISFGVYKYPKVSGLKPYDEFLVSIPVQYKQVSGESAAKKYNPLFPNKVYNKNGSYIYYLPVSTEESFIAGSEIWGFPKVQRRLVFEENEKSIKRLLYNNNILEMTLSINKLGLPNQKKAFTYCAYTKKSNQLLRTCLQANGIYRVKNFGIKAAASFNEGAVSRTLSKLTISKTSVQVFYATNVSGR